MQFTSVRAINAACRRLQYSQRQVRLQLPDGETRRVLRAKSQQGQLIVLLLSPLGLNQWRPCELADLMEQ